MSSGSQNLDTRLLRHRTRPGSEPLAALAADLIDAGRAREAMEVTGAALDERPDDGELLLLDGRARLALGELLGAQAALLRAAKALPRRSEPFRWLAEVLMKRGDPERALKVLDRALALDPTDRAISELRARSARLVNLVSDVDAAPAPAEEPTVLRADLTEQLRSMTAEVDAAEAAAGERLEPAARPQMPASTLAFGAPAAKIPPPPSRIPANAAQLAGRADVAPPTEPTRAPPRSALEGRERRPLTPPKPPAPWIEPPTTKVAALEREAEEARPPAPALPEPFDEPPTAKVATTDAEAVVIEEPPPPAPARFDEPPTTKRSADAPVEPAAGATESRSPSESDGASSPPSAEAKGEGSEVDAILHMLRERGLFEPPQSEPASWARRAEVRAVKKAQGAGTRVGLGFGVVWLLALAAAAGGWYGWNWHVGERQREAGLKVERARELAWRGAHADLARAELDLREARELDPHDPSGPTLLLFVQGQRALEDGELQGSGLRLALRRAEALEEELEAARLEAARAALAICDGKRDEARRAIDAALEGMPDDAAILYLAGRVEQHLGGERALAHLEAAAEADSTLIAARIALAELRHDAAELPEALALIDGVLASDPEHLRAKLWRIWLTSDSAEPADALRALEALEASVREGGAAADRLLHALARARLARRRGEDAAASEALDAALMAGASAPRLLAWAAAEALRAGRAGRALSAARTALSGAPENVELRKLLARIELARRDGRGALSTLAGLDAPDRDVVAMRARASLLDGSEEAMREALEALEATLEDAADAIVELSALRLRLQSRLGETSRLLAQARALARRAPGDPDVSLALGEVALAARDAREAVRALDSAVRASPDDAEAHYLLGRARRLAGDGEGAEQSLRRAIELSPEHTEARLTLGALLLDMGRYEEADAHYVELTSVRGGQAAAMAGRLGRAEALTGLGRFEDATAQLEALQPELRELGSARIAAARLALARRQAGDALRELRPLATGEGASAAVLALYADALLMAGEVEAAADAYAAALGADAGLPEALLGQAEMAVRSERARDTLGLLVQLERSLEARVRPASMRARMHLLRGRAQLLGGRDSLSAAREELRAATAIDGAPPEAHFFLGEALAGANSPEARASYERYLELAPEGEYAARARRAIRR